MSQHEHRHRVIEVKVLRGTGKETKKVSWPSLDGGTAATPIPLPSEPIVDLQAQPDGKSKIIVTCTCGKRIEILCEI